MYNFLDRYQIPKLNQDQLDQLNSPITTKEIEGDIESLPTKKVWDQMVSVQNFIRYSKDLTPRLFKVFHKIETKGTLCNSLFIAKITLIPKPHKDPTKKRTIGQFPL